MSLESAGWRKPLSTHRTGGGTRRRRRHTTAAPMDVSTTPLTQARARADPMQMSSPFPTIPDGDWMGPTPRELAMPATQSYRSPPHDRLTDTIWSPSQVASPRTPGTAPTPIVTPYDTPTVASLSQPVQALYIQRASPAKPPVVPIPPPLARVPSAFVPGGVLQSLADGETTKPKAIHILGPQTNRLTCMRSYHQLKEINKGSWGRILQVCDQETTQGQPCPRSYALKVVTLRQASDRDVAERDSYFLSILADIKLDGQYIVPRLIDTWSCRHTSDPNDTFYILMDEWDGDMDHLIQRRGYVRATELLRMFRIAVLVGYAGIAHKDLKPNQYLQRNDGHELSLTDYGFSGGPTHPYQAKEGWPSKAKDLKCQRAFTVQTWSPSTESLIPAYDNVFQLETYLLKYTRAAVVDDLHDRFSQRRKAFAGIRDFSSLGYDTRCTGPGMDKLARLRTKLLARSDAISFSLSDIGM